jgi:high-affinity iron transporter
MSMDRGLGQSARISLAQVKPGGTGNPNLRRVVTAGVIASIALVLGVFVWQAFTSGGNPDPTVKGISPAAAILDTGILVFREGLEAILVLAALTASVSRTEEGHWQPVALGAGISFLATVATWFIAVALISDIANSVPALDIQAATGLLAVIVLLIIMNWFFHKIYWTGWITYHNRRQRALTGNSNHTRERVFRGLAVIGFTSVYREGFEVVLFLQSIRLQVGSHVVLQGVLLGLALTGIVAMLTFVAHYKLPYKRMLVLTGIMIGVVLLVMVGEQVQEMQQANWIGTHTLNIHMPDWLNTWFSIYPSVESLGAQGAAALFVIGSYYLARRVCGKVKTGVASQEICVVPDCENCPVGDSSGQRREEN